MNAAVFTFETTHHAIWAEETATECGIPVLIVPAPAGARARCNLALETLPDDAARLATALVAAGIPHGRYP